MVKRLPSWLKKRLPSTGSLYATKNLVASLGLNTVCQSALCPNLGECFSKKTATFMIMGNLCTRNCRFCAVESGEAKSLDISEPFRVAMAIKELSLKHAVVTSVTRDDLADGGASHFAQTVREIKSYNPGVIIEVLTPDFNGDWDCLSQVVEAGPHIYNHNVETVPRLYKEVRPQAFYERSLELLSKVKIMNPSIFTKSGFMLGLGEKKDEVVSLMQDLYGNKVNIVTIGQYLQPSQGHLPVIDYVTPEEFDCYRKIGEDMGFQFVVSGPFVRSSFNAKEFSELHM
ncbi:MAG: lipoyl synthase [Syntrophomonadaceae bacterium]|nr:lipoyl synthase [Syntrophomonadaceae bacterium]